MLLIFFNVCTYILRLPGHIDSAHLFQQLTYALQIIGSCGPLWSSLNYRNYVWSSNASALIER